MNYQLHQNGSSAYLEILPGAVQIASEQDALDWVATCGEQRVRRLLLYGTNLAPAFFDLKTGLAGAVLLKFSNYRLQVAAVLTPVQVGQEGRFSEFAAETRRNREFRIFCERDEAVQWLVT